MTNPTISQQPSPQMKASGFAGLFGLFAALCAIFAGCVTLIDWREEILQARWPIATAVVERADLAVSAHRDGSERHWNLSVHLRYEADGQQRTANVTSQPVYSEEAVAELHAWFERHQGRLIDIRYDPARPRSAIFVLAEPGFVSERTKTDLVLFSISAVLSFGLLTLARFLVAREARGGSAVDDPQRASPLLGLLFAAPGLATAIGAIYRAVGKDAYTLEDLIAVLIGLMFVLAGCLIVLPPRYARARSLLGTLVVTLMAAVFDWVAFGPGERHFVGSIEGFSFVSSEMTGRVLFGIAAVTMNICVVAMWIALCRGTPFSDHSPPDSTNSSAGRSHPARDRCSVA